MVLTGVVGPTGVGKTAIAAAVARATGGELLNADSRQVLRGLRVGTCAPTPAELGGARCHLLALAEPGEDFTVADWVAAARTALDDLEARRVPAILTGGTGLYVDALVDGFDVAGGRPDPELRGQRDRRAAQPGGLAALAAELRRRDPRGAAAIDLRNPRRVIRALEILDAGAGGLERSRRRSGGRPAVLLGIDAPRPLHRRLIERRTEAMLATGELLAETAAALDRGVPRPALARAGIGYREAIAVLDGSLSMEAARAAVLARTIRYARAQRTWFGRRRDVHWLVREDGEGAVEALLGEALAALAAPAAAV